jgi:RHS repeat-associated protein
MGRRVKKTVYDYNAGSWQLNEEKLFVYDGWNLVEEITVVGATETSRYFVWGLDLSQSLQGAGGIGGLIAAVDSSDTYYFSYDGNGNVGQVIDASSGTIAASYQYDPFGNLIKSEGAYADDNPFRFSTKYHDDETGLVYYGYRYYSSELGRWINRDPMQEPGGINLYIFISNNPLDDFDSVGLFGFQDVLKQLTEGTYELDIPIGSTGWDFVGTLKLERAEAGCWKFTFAMGVSISVKEKIMRIVSKTPAVGSNLKKMVGKLSDVSAQIFASGSGKVCCNCWDFTKTSLNVSLTIGNGAHGGNPKSGLDLGLWATGTGEWDMSEGTLSVGGNLNWALSVNKSWVAYNADGSIWKGNLIGPVGAQNTLLEIGGPYDSLKQVVPCSNDQGKSDAEEFKEFLENYDPSKEWYAG